MTALLLALLLPTSLPASHDETLPLNCETFRSRTLSVRLCAWDKPSWESERVQAVVDAVAKGAGIKWYSHPLHVIVTYTDPVTLSPRILGFFDPASKAIFISPDAEPGPPNYRFYYALGHELMHAVYDQWHVSWDKQHCRMYQVDSELQPVRDLIREWSPDAQFENPLAVIFACRGDSGGD